MPEASLPLFVLALLVAAAYSIANGVNDAANAIATVISTRVLSPRAAIVMGSLFNLLGALVGLEVARTVGKGIVDPQQMTMVAVVAGGAAGAAWTFLATRFGWPISVTHSIVGGILGAGLAVAGFDAIVWAKFERVLISVALAPILGMVGGYILMLALYLIFRRSAPARVQSVFGRLQILSAAYMAFSHGRNDGQNARGIMMLALVVYTGNAVYWDSPPFWIYVLPALLMGLGTAMGGWRVIQTLGVRVTLLQPINGFAAETSGATVIEVASQLGLPVSTTHSITGAILGVGATRRLSAVRWGVARHIVAAWILTFPVTIVTGYLLTQLLGLFLEG